MAGRDVDEYRNMRDTIALRGTWRPALMLGGTALWAALLIAVLVLLPYPLASTIPLLVLVAAFETIRTLHFGSERIGRYLQVFHEETGGKNDGWPTRLPGKARPWSSAPGCPGPGDTRSLSPYSDWRPPSISWRAAPGAHPDGVGG